MDARESYKNYRELGMSKDLARHMAMREGWDEELDAFRQGLSGFTEEEAWLATVHARQDIILMVSDLGEIIREQRKTNRRLTFLVLLLIVIAVFLPR